MATNRTILELKLHAHPTPQSRDRTTNRTILELKHNDDACTIWWVAATNRTILELKPGSTDFPNLVKYCHQSHHTGIETRYSHYPAF